MENRRLAVLCRHLRPGGPVSVPLTASACSSADYCEGLQKRGVKDGNPPDGCVFCRIIRGDSPAFKLYEDDKCLCILDANPLCHGHSLIIPKCHYSSLEETPPSVIAAMCSKVPLIGTAIKRAAGCDSFNLLVNNGAAAGQVIFHTHIHIIPRKARDCLWASESIRRNPLNFNLEASKLLERVREELSQSSSSGETRTRESSLSGYTTSQ
ncbi:hypothetical protein MLD38_028234 [Melastoma candidum]|uniref:Uncharacterized protein n=1 Tax=Melastoma candidum TaxID=119954 RepID=A0ACB9N0Z2_9MYRT|nr:hypothetical protein MLD38_028234 [Melastoma candidum]